MSSMRLESKSELQYLKGNHIDGSFNWYFMRFANNDKYPYFYPLYYINTNIRCIYTKLENTIKY